MATQTHPTHPAQAANPAAHSAWILLPYLRELVPLDLSENIQLSAINFNGYASFGYQAPQPDRGGSFFEDIGYPYCGEYFDTGLNEASEFRMRQAFDLQSWVGLDAVEVLIPTTEQFPPAEAARLDFDEMAARRQFVKKKRHLTVRLQKVKLLQLHNLVALAKTLFDRLLLVEPTDRSTTPFPAKPIRG